ncbi:hypothetical protein B0H17DRAFT_405281 [Mycena rosella]|uniref:BRCT domain-containing protein n=1 Tax=Mycena rosella TaxID=1033263 RepID=A0AAD7CM24_MYCRO|nr:hypothetical protein B0H17DRAFT_405281 [Mycena rosella]
MRYADKFNRAGEADPPIQLVWEEWFWDCVEFGGRFDEVRYQARMPRPERRATDAFVPPPHEIPDLQHRTTAYDDDVDDADDGDELVLVQRLPAVTLQLWGSLKARGYEVARGSVMLSPGKAREMAVQGREEAAVAPVEGSSGSMLSNFRRANLYVAPRTTALPAPCPRARAGPHTRRPAVDRLCRLEVPPPWRDGHDDCARRHRERKDKGKGKEKAEETETM